MSDLLQCGSARDWHVGRGNGYKLEEEYFGSVERHLLELLLHDLLARLLCLFRKILDTTTAEEIAGSAPNSSKGNNHHEAMPGLLRGIAPVLICRDRWH